MSEKETNLLCGRLTEQITKNLRSWRCNIKIKIEPHNKSIKLLFSHEKIPTYKSFVYMHQVKTLPKRDPEGNELVN